MNKIFYFLKRKKISDNFFAFRPVSISISKNAKINIIGSLDFNVTQTYNLNNKSVGYIVIGDNANINCIGNFVISSGCRLGVLKNAELTLGSGYINYDSKIYCFNKVSIGQNVAIGENVIIRDSDNHSLTGQQSISAPIIIEDNVWIGMNSTILKGVRIGKGSVIAAGSVVTHDIPENCVAAGVPAKVIRENISWQI